MKNLREDRKMVASSLVLLAKTILAEEDGEDKDDLKMTEKLRKLKTMLPQLNSKRNKTLKQLGIDTNIKTTTKLEELVDMLTQMTAQ